MERGSQAAGLEPPSPLVQQEGEESPVGEGSELRDS